MKKFIQYLNENQDLSSMKQQYEDLWQKIYQMPEYQEIQRLQDQENKLSVYVFGRTKEQDDQEWKERLEIKRKIKELEEELHKNDLLHQAALLSQKIRKIEQENQARIDLQNQEQEHLTTKDNWHKPGGDLSYEERLKLIGKNVPAHGADVSDLDSILQNGLQPESALDLTPNKEWAFEYPVCIIVPSARKGKKIEHNNYYVSSNVARVAKVIIDISQYQEEYQEEYRKQIQNLIKKYPQIIFEICEKTFEN